MVQHQILRQTRHTHRMPRDGGATEGRAAPKDWLSNPSCKFGLETSSFIINPNKKTRTFSNHKISSMRKSGQSKSGMTKKPRATPKDQNTLSSVQIHLLQNYTWGGASARFARVHLFGIVHFHCGYFVNPRICSLTFRLVSSISIVAFIMQHAPSFLL